MNSLKNPLGLLRIIAAVCAVLLTLPSAAVGEVGGVDPAFNANVFDNGGVLAMARQPDGKLIVGGSFAAINGVLRNRVARLNPDGSLDPSFDAAPEIIGDIQAVAVQSDGKILIGGYIIVAFNFSDYKASVELARLNIDGSLDVSFRPLPADSTVLAIQPLPTGQILVGGGFTKWGQVNKRRLARINSDGSLDSTFDVGLLGTLISDRAVYAIALQPDGKIVIGGSFTTISAAQDVSPRLGRLNSDGSIDGSFNTGSGPQGALLPRVFSIALQPDGKIVIGGAFDTYNGTARKRVARVNSDGSLDTSFDGPGIIQGRIIAAALQSDGKVVIAGDNGADIKEGRFRRLNSDGSLDTSFNSGEGSFAESLDSSGLALLLEPDGKILMAGLFSRYRATPCFGLVRVNPDGSVDTSYSGGAFNRGVVRDVVQQPDGKILIGGDFVSVNGSARSNFARLNADGTVDNTFNTSGTDGTVRAIKLQTDNKIMVGGDFLSFNGVGLTYPRLIRVNPDGSRDTGFAARIDNSAAADGPVWAIVVQADGKIIYGGDFSMRLLRVDSAGNFDLSFVQARGFADPDARVRTLVLQPDGKILVGGDFQNIGSTVRRKIARLGGTGALDASFAPASHPILRVNSLALQSDGKILASGTAASSTTASRTGIIRLAGDGTRDTSFDITNWLGITSCGGMDLTKVVVLPDGKILFGGTVTFGNCVGFNATGRRLYRVLENGSPDPSFVPGVGADGDIFTFSVLPDGAVLVGGGFTSYNAASHQGLARLLNQPLQSSRLLNIATRLRVLTAENVLIGGFIISGPDPKTVLLRAIGPSLTALGVPGALADPVLELRDSAGALLARNDEWRETQQAMINSTTIPPQNDHESAIVRTLEPGAYTAIISGRNDTTGLAIMEGYDLDQAADSQLANISTRGFVDTGGNVMIGGFIIGGNGGNQRIVVRAIAPSLSAFGIMGALQDPILDLKDANGATLLSNDNWKQSQEGDISPTGLAPTDIRESALIISLSGGNYTAIVAGKDNATGVAVVEVYNLP